MKEQDLIEVFEELRFLILQGHKIPQAIDFIIDDLKKKKKNETKQQRQTKRIKL